MAPDPSPRLRTLETLVDLVTEAGRRFDRRPALLIRPVFRTRKWRYRDLAALVPRVAGLLAGTGIEKGDRVVIWAVNRPEWGIAFLGAAHAGAVLVPLDVRTPAELAQKIVEKTAPEACSRRPKPSPPRARSACRCCPSSRFPDLAHGPRARGAEHRARRPGRDRLHLGHHRRAEGRDDQPPKPRQQRHGPRRTSSPWHPASASSRSCPSPTSSSRSPDSWPRSSRGRASSTRSAASRRS